MSSMCNEEMDTVRAQKGWREKSLEGLTERLYQQTDGQVERLDDV